jgi:hypothetical protein
VLHNGGESRYRVKAHGGLELKKSSLSGQQLRYQIQLESTTLHGLAVVSERVFMHQRCSTF